MLSVLSFNSWMSLSRFHIHTCTDSAVEGCVPLRKNRKIPISVLMQSTADSADRFCECEWTLRVFLLGRQLCHSQRKKNPHCRCWGLFLNLSLLLLTVKQFLSSWRLSVVLSLFLETLKVCKCCRWDRPSWNEMTSDLTDQFYIPFTFEKIDNTQTLLTGICPTF